MHILEQFSGSFQTDALVDRACRRPPIMEITFLCVEKNEMTHWSIGSHRCNFDLFDIHQRSWVSKRRIFTPLVKAVLLLSVCFQFVWISNIVQAKAGLYREREILSWELIFSNEDVISNVRSTIESATTYVVLTLYIMFWRKKYKFVYIIEICLSSNLHDIYTIKRQCGWWGFV